MVDENDPVEVSRAVFHSISQGKKMKLNNNQIEELNKIDFKKRVVLLTRNAGRETKVCDPKWISFELIDHVFKPDDLIFQNFITAIIITTIIQNED